MHLFDPVTHFSCSGIIAEGYPVSCGQALAFKRQGTGRISVAVAGEGAANQGAFHESLNLAALWRLPVVFVIEDNDWAISVPRSKSTPVASNAERAAGYGMPGVRIEGNDVEAIHEAAGEAVARARGGQGPSLIEVHTVRLWGHFEGDAQAYRGAELDTLDERDPIPRYAAALEGARRDRRGRHRRDRCVDASPGRRGDRLRQGQPAAARPSPRWTTSSPDEEHTMTRQSPRSASCPRRRRSPRRSRRRWNATRSLRHGRGRRGLRRHLRRHHRPARAVRPGAGHRHPDLRDGVHRRRHRRRHRGPAARSSS